MSQDLKRASEVPEAHAYVLADDSFMSGWGGAANAINTIILPVASNAEAEVVYANVRSRPEMRRARIVVERPRFARGHAYSLMTRATAPRWYEPDAFQTAGKGRKRRGGKPRAAVGAGVWQPEEIGGFWCVVNKTTGQKVKVGRVGGPRGNLRGINYYDRACQEARRRNGGVDYAWQINNPGWKASQCAPGVPAARLSALADAVRKLVR